MVRTLLRPLLLLGWAAAVQAQPAPPGSAPPAPTAPVSAPPVSAAPASAPPADAALEKRVAAIAAELRCLVCQNQTIADSNAALAQDLREQVRQMLRAGKSEAEVIAFMTERYGDFVLYRPPMRGSTALLWFGPALMLLGGVATLVWVLRRRARLSPDQFEPDPTDDDEQQQQR